MIDRARSAHIIEELFNDQVGLPLDSDLFRKLVSQGATFVLRAPAKSVLPRNFKALAERKGSEFFALTAYDLKSRAVTLEKIARAIYWIVDNLDGEFAIEDLGESLERHFGATGIYIVRYDEAGNFKSISECSITSGTSISETMVCIATVGCRDLVGP